MKGEGESDAPYIARCRGSCHLDDFRCYPVRAPCNILKDEEKIGRYEISDGKKKSKGM